MKHLRHFFTAGLAALAVSLLAVPGCAMTGMPGTSQSAALSPVKQISVGIAAVKGVRVLADQLLVTKKITAAQAQNVQERADIARASLDIARSLIGTDTSSAVAKLNAATLILAELNEFLISKGGS
jgi:hypothetical protein